MKFFLSVMLLASNYLMAQEKADSGHVAGIQFAKDSSWQQVLIKAKKESKYIFVDCFATWCGPCRLMDRNVFTQKSVGDFINMHFIPVRVQMDPSKTDDRFVKSWYS